MHARLLPFIALWICIATGLNSHATERPFFCCDYVGGKVAVVSAEGKIEWEYACKAPQDCWKLPNGNYLFCFASGALELTPAKEKIWEYKAPEKTEVQSCQPLPGGNVLVVECGSSRLLEVDRAGKIAREIKLVTKPAVQLHNQFRGARKTADGHYLVCFKGEGKVVELDGGGKQLREIGGFVEPHEVVALPAGHLLITCGDGHRVVELDEHEKVVWELKENDLPDNPLRLIAGCQRLPNGNTICCNFLGHGHIGKQPMFFEVTPDKKVVWQFADHAHFKTINQIQVLDIPGDVVKGEIQR